METFDPNERSYTRWTRWRNYIDTGKSRVVLSEYKALLASNRQLTAGDAKLREEALLTARQVLQLVDKANVLEFRKKK